MKQKVLFLSLCLMMVLLAACGPSPKEKLNGHWKIDTEATMNAMPEDANPVDKKAISLFSRMTFDIDIEAGTLRRSMGPLTRDGKFELLSEKDETVAIKMDDGSIFSFTFIGDKTIKVEQPDDKTVLIFIKK